VGGSGLILGHLVCIRAIIIKERLLFHTHAYFLFVMMLFFIFCFNNDTICLHLCQLRNLKNHLNAVS